MSLDKQNFINQKSKSKKEVSENNENEIELIDFLIIGAGLTGCTTAYYLEKYKKGGSILICENTDQIGGCIRTEKKYINEKESITCELGPNTVVLNHSLSKFFDEIGLKKMIILCKPSLPRYIFLKKYKLIKAPMSFVSFILFPFLSCLSKLKILRAILFGLPPSRQALKSHKGETKLQEEKIKEEEQEEIKEEEQEEIKEEEQEEIKEEEQEEIKEEEQEEIKEEEQEEIKEEEQEEIKEEEGGKKEERIKEKKDEEKEGKIKTKEEEEKDENIKNYVIKHLGCDTYNILVQPFIGGIYACDPKNLSASLALPNITSKLTSGLIWKAAYKFANATNMILKKFIGLLKFYLNLKTTENNEVDYGEKKKESERLIFTLKEGLSVFPNRIIEIIGKDKVRLNWTLTRIEKMDMQKNAKCEKEEPKHTTNIKNWNGDLWIATFNTKYCKIKKVLAKSILITTNSYVACEVLSNLLPKDVQIDLRNIKYSSIHTVCLAYEKRFLSFKFYEGKVIKNQLKDKKKKESSNNVQYEGFGHLIPKKEGMLTLGTIWLNSIFPITSPPHLAVFTSFLGGFYDNFDYYKQKTDEEIIEIADQELRDVVVDKDAPPPLIVSMKKWEESIPQIGVQHRNVIQKLKKLNLLINEETNEIIKTPNYIEGIIIDANWISGISVPERIEASEKNAKFLISYFNKYFHNDSL